LTRERQFKPLEVSKTIRNPERIKKFLKVVKDNFNGDDLSKETIYGILKILVKKGLYKPDKYHLPPPHEAFKQNIKSKWEAEEELTDDEVEIIMNCTDNIHSSAPRKYAGFEKGWCSRFWTQYEEIRSLGFIEFSYQSDIPGERNSIFREESIPIKLTKLGELLLDENKNFSLQLSFLNGIANYQRNNIFEKVLNKNKPFILLLKLLKKFYDEDENSPGLSRKELAIFTVWKDDNVDDLYEAVINFRSLHGARPTEEQVFDFCGQTLDLNSELGGWDRSRNITSIVTDNTDVIIRYMLMSGLIVPRGISHEDEFARYISLNKDLIELINYLIEERSDLYSDYENYSIENYLEAAGSIDTNIEDYLDDDYVVTTACTEQQLDFWIEKLGIETIKNELLNLSQNNRTVHPELREITDFLRLEFLTALYLRSQNKDNQDVKIQPYYLVVENGFPFHHAPAGKPDIEFTSNDVNKIVEVTLQQTQQQNIREVVPITTRKIPNFQEMHPEGFADLISPSFHPESKDYAEYKRDTQNILCNLITIEEFISS